MIFHTYGNKESKAIVLIHGMLTPWQIWNTAVKKFSEDYYVVVPELEQVSYIRRIDVKT